MEKINLAWAIIWTVVFVTCIVGFFWNPSHIFTAAIAAIMAGMFWHDYRKTKGM